MNNKHVERPGETDADVQSINQSPTGGGERKMAGSRRNTVICTQTAEINNHQYGSFYACDPGRWFSLLLWAGKKSTQVIAVFRLAAVITLHHQQVTGFHKEFDSLLYWLGIEMHSVNLTYDPHKYEFFTSSLWAASSSLNPLLKKKSNN